MTNCNWEDSGFFWRTKSLWRRLQEVFASHLRGKCSRRISTAEVCRACRTPRTRGWWGWRLRGCRSRSEASSAGCHDSFWKTKFRFRFSSGLRSVVFGFQFSIDVNLKGNSYFCHSQNLKFEVWEHYWW